MACACNGHLGGFQSGYGGAQAVPTPIKLLAVAVVAYVIWSFKPPSGTKPRPWR